MNKVNPRLQLTGADIDKKWRNLIQTFRKIRDKKNKTGRGRVHWKFYDAMENATQDKASVVPPSNLLVSSAESKTPDDTDVEARSGSAVLLSDCRH